MDTLSTRITQILDTDVRPVLRKDGGDVRMEELSNDVLTLRVLGRCSSCPNVHTDVTELAESALAKNGINDVSVEIFLPVDPDLNELAKKILRKEITLE